jgi:hypothetical protein
LLHRRIDRDILLKGGHRTFAEGERSRCTGCAKDGFDDKQQRVVSRVFSFQKWRHLV